MTTHEHPQQLPLLVPAEDAPVQLRLDARTRRIGLEGVARARAVLAESQRRRLQAEEDARLARQPAHASAHGLSRAAAGAAATAVAGHTDEPRQAA
jgi:hypothetical protein